MTTEPKIRVVVVDDHYIAREGLKSLINSQADMETVGEAPDGAEALTVYRKTLPDVVLMDMRLPRLDGVASTAALLTAHPGARILILSSYDTEADVGRAHDAGALGYLSKEAEGAELLTAIRTVRRGRRYLPPALAARLENRRPEPRLGTRDTQILHLLQKGSTNEEIAAALELSKNTARVYVSSVLWKLGARNRTEAVTIAVTRGLLKSDG
jgi:two-component system NarL family response regulator